MAKLTLNDIASGFQSTTAANTNNALIEAALENTLSRDGASPNQMESDFDMNSNRILNLPDPIDPGEPVTLRVYDAASSPSAAAALVSAAAALVSEGNAAASEIASAASELAAAASAAAALVSETNAGNSSISAAGSAVAASASASLAQSYTSMGFGGTLLDLGQVSDATIYFPTDLGVLV